ncbi:hypothetical protein Patl1_35027 [Pistacia atlantica]|uniref:Uncharacterized protein n=1 Tax=Pistacia atlantica TaxID=434234 RepID=A0ACC0ZX43_9ROSI|nr:hypothetical protein Patl1_35027 [Pistacia atlantica]
MSYLPPHLRNSTSDSMSKASPTNSSVVTLNTDHSKLSFSSNSNSVASFSNAFRRTAAAQTLPEPVFATWKPSDRILRLQPQQIEEVRSRLHVDVNVGSRSLPAPPPIESFTDMCLHPSIMEDIEFHEYTRPTSIQAQAMPVALSGRDLLGCAETGSGKTAAFTIPMIQHCLAQTLVRRGDGPLALVLAPTRELAQQIEKEVRFLAI